MNAPPLLTPARRRRSIRRVIGRLEPLVAITVVVVAAGCGGGDGHGAVGGATRSVFAGTPGSAEFAGIQSTDLPAGMTRCGYSGPVHQYVAGISSLGSTTESILETEAKLASHGASEIRIVVYADGDSGCEEWIRGAAPDAKPGRAVSNVMVTFPDDQAALAAFEADVFGQSGLAAYGGAVSGRATGLGAQSVVAEGATGDASYQAIWRQVHFNSYVLARGIDITEADAIAAAISRRMTTPPGPT